MLDHFLIGKVNYKMQVYDEAKINFLPLAVFILKNDSRKIKQFTNLTFL
jgi:TolA-binding protein